MRDVVRDEIVYFCRSAHGIEKMVQVGLGVLDIHRAAKPSSDPHLDQGGGEQQGEPRTNKPKGPRENSANPRLDAHADEGSRDRRVGLAYGVRRIRSRTLSGMSERSTRRLGIVTIDQALSGGSNVLILLCAAQLLTAGSFGYFTVIYLIYATAQGIARALTCEPLLVHHEEARKRSGEAAGAAMIVGILIGVVVVGSGLVVLQFDRSLGVAWVILGLLMPFLVLHDWGRYLGFATLHPSRALGLDVAWLVLVVGGAAILLISGTRELWAFTAVWAGSGAVASLAVFWQGRGARDASPMPWLRETWRYSWRYLASFSAMQGGALAATGVVGMIEGPRSLGGINGAALLARPFAMAQVAAVASGVSEISAAGRDRTVVRNIVRRTTMVAAIMAALNGLVMIALPDVLGELVLSDTWSVAEPLLLATAFQILAMSLTTGPRAGLVGLRAVSRTLRLDLTTTVIQVVCATVGILVGGAEGAIWTIGLGYLVMSVVWRAGLAREVSQPPEDVLVPPAST